MHGAAVLAAAAEDLVDENAQHVADRHQLEQPQCQQAQRAHGARRVKAVFFLELRQQRPGPADGSLRDGGKQAQKQQIAVKPPLDRALPGARVK